MNKHKQSFLDLGYKTAIILSFSGIIGSAVYLFFFLGISHPGTITESVALTAERRFQLLSAGIFVGMSFGFLGFALFLIQAKGDVDIEFEKPANEASSSYKLKLARLSPGLFVLLCATVIIIICVKFSIEYNVSRTTDGDVTAVYKEALQRVLEPTPERKALINEFDLLMNKQLRPDFSYNGKTYGQDQTKQYADDFVAKEIDPLSNAHQIRIMGPDDKLKKLVDALKEATQ